MEANQYTFDAAFNNETVQFPADCDHIKTVAAEMGILMTQHQAEQVWEWHSGRMCAGWLNLDDDDEIRDVIRAFIISRLES